MICSRPPFISQGDTPGLTRRQMSQRLWRHLLRLPPEGAALGQTALSSGGLAQDCGAVAAENDGLRIAEDGCDREAARALNIHEPGVRALYEPLELVLALLRLLGRVKKIYVEECHCHLSTGRQ